MRSLTARSRGRGTLLARGGLGFLLLSIGLGAGVAFSDRLRTVGGTPDVQPLNVGSRDLHPVDKELYYDERVLVVDEGNFRRFGGIFPGLDSKVTVVASGICHAGIDHRKVEPEYKIDGRTIIAVLGEPEVFDCGDTEVRFIRGEGVFQAPESLRNNLYLRAMDALKQQAVRDSLDQKARQEAELREEVKLRKLGFSTVTISFRKALPPELQPQPLPSPAASRSS
jgi:hypothetical protein